MKAKVIIENGITNIILKPENDFEIDILEKVYLSENKYEIKTTVNAKGDFGYLKEHQLEINLVKKQ